MNVGSGMEDKKSISKINSYALIKKNFDQIVLHGYLIFQKACVGHYEACFFITVKQCRLV